MKQFLFLALAASMTFVSCSKDTQEKQDKQKIFKGPITDFQHGKAWTWLETNGYDVPVRLAIAIDDEAMNSLDRSGGEGGGDHHHDNSVVLKFHSKVSSTPFNHVDLGWNPHGHEPDFIYGLAHFDFHFYTVSPAEVAAIPPYEVDSTKFKNWPAPAYFPPTYFNPGGGVPQMGVHWLDFTSPELNGAPFTQTLIYGSYDGKVTFLEPMITEQFILNNPTFSRAIPQPAKVQKTGYYPTKMRIAKESGTTNIILEDFVFRTAS